MRGADRALTIPVCEGAPLPALLRVPAGRDVVALLVLAHGAGAGMRHAFMADLAGALGEAGVATLRWEFPWMAAGRRMPDRPAVALPAVAAAVARGATIAGELAVPLLAGGKSFGGRMTSEAAAAGLLDAPVAGLVFVGFPLHPARKPGTDRAAHLSRVGLPLLFLQGTRDALADRELLTGVVNQLRVARGGGGSPDPAVDLHMEEGADHGFSVLKRSGRTAGEVHRALASAVAAWARGGPGFSASAGR